MLKFFSVRFLAPKKGFTLIELMISITILAIISSIGFVTYSNSQIAARDGKRKQDLRSIATALELYYQTNKRYPCPGNGTWVDSSGGGNWIVDTDFTNCGDVAPAKPLDLNYINFMPIDPKNSGGTSGTWGGVNTSYIYGYRGYQGGCPSKKGQFYLLVAQLENKSDSQRQGIRKVKDCVDNATPGSSSLSGGAWDTAYVLSNE